MPHNGTHNGNGKLNGSTVFVVDDDTSVRRSVESLVDSVGLASRSFDSAQSFLSETQPDQGGCLVLDVRMPGMSGLDLLDRLRQDGYTLPVIMMTGWADVPMAVRALKAGAVEFLQKPVNEQVLIDHVQSALDLDKGRRVAASGRDEIRTRIRTLTPREREVMDLVVDGKANKEVAGELGLSEKTIEVHRARLMRKMGAGNAADLVRMVMEVRLAG
jgi:two-component system response regulator FixJ